MEQDQLEKTQLQLEKKLRKFFTNVEQKNIFNKFVKVTNLIGKLAAENAQEGVLKRVLKDCQCSGVSSTGYKEQWFFLKKQIKLDEKKGHKLFNKIQK